MLGLSIKEKLLALKDIAGDQKEKIILLRNQKSQLEKQVDKMNDDLEIEKQYIHTIQMDLGQKIKKLKSDIKTSEEVRKALNAENAENLDKNQSLIKKNEELVILVQKEEQMLNMKEEEVENIDKKTMIY